MSNEMITSYKESSTDINTSAASTFIRFFSIIPSIIFTAGETGWEQFKFQKFQDIDDKCSFHFYLKFHLK